MSRLSEPLSAVDAAWLRMEEPSNLMTITGVLTLEGRVDFERLRRTVEERLLDHPRFRRRVVEGRLPFSRPRWRDDDTFTLGQHLRRIALPAPADQERLQALVSELMSTPLDFSKPLWQFHLVENYRGGSALVGRIHHCIGDGLSLLPVLLSLTDGAAEGAGRNVREGGELGASGLPRWARGLYEGGLEVLARPEKVVDLARSGGDAALTFGRLLAMGADAPTPLKGRLRPEKRAAWSGSLSLERVKEIGRRRGGTVNDVLLATLAGALRRYLEDRGELREGLEIRAVVPVNIRSPEDRSLGNRFGLVFLPLPVGTADSGERLERVHRRMTELKGSSEAMVSFAILQAVGSTTAQVERLVLDLFGQKATLVATNVPGPREPLDLCGRPLRSLMFWVPTSGRLGLGVSILSYAGGVRIGVAADRGLVPDPERIVALYQEALEELEEGDREVG